MEIKFTDDELLEAFTVIINRMADEAGLPDKDRATLKRWRSLSLSIVTLEMFGSALPAAGDPTTWMSSMVSSSAPKRSFLITHCHQKT